MLKKNILFLLILSLCFSVTVSSKVYNTVTYDTIRESLKQLYDLYIQADILIGRRYADAMDKVERDNYKRMDKQKAICRQILKIARGLQKIIPDAVKIIERDLIIVSTDGNEKRYGIEILREELEKSLGKMPSDIEKLFPALNTYDLPVLQKDENFSYVEWIQQQRKKVKDNVTYDTIRVPLKQFYNLYPELAPHLEASVNASYACVNARKRGKKDELEAASRQLQAVRRQIEATSRQILKIAKELHEIVPNAVRIWESIQIPQRSCQRSQLAYSRLCTIHISSQELEIVLGKMPSDIQKLFSNYQYLPLFFWGPRQEYENLSQSELAKIGFPKESDLLVIGPFDNPDNKGKISPYPPEMEINFSATYQGSPSPLSPLSKGEGRRAVRWQEADDGKMDGVLDFTKIFTPTEWVLAYVLIDVISPDDRKAFLRIGSDDGVKVWLNGQVVWTNQVPRPLGFDDDLVLIELKQGNNRLLFKVDQGTEAWELIVRITDEMEQAIEGLRYQTPK